MASATWRATSAKPTRGPGMVKRVWKTATAFAIVYLIVAPQLALADVRPPSVLERLEPSRRVKVLSAVAGLIILGFGLVLLAWLGARATRRYMHREPILREKPPTGTPVREKDWTEKPMGRPFEE
jgi:hypothetical protein